MKEKEGKGEPDKEKETINIKEKEAKGGSGPASGAVLELSKSESPPQSVNSANNSKLSSVTSKSKELSVKAPSKVVNGSDGKADAKLLKIPQINKELGKLPNVSTSRVSGEQKRVLLSKEKALCPPVPPKLVGSVKIYRSVPTLEEQEKSRPELEPGGRFRPAECRARHRVAIIIPYRDRVQHLAMFIYHIHPILQRQQIDYAIYVVEQAGSGKFNRAMLMNVGALEALKQYPYDCFIFHDVDLLPEDDRNLYTCPEQPRHMSIAIDSMGYKLPYNDIFGGVSAMTADQFRTVNGFSNKFWGWGGEDDDMSNRIKFHGFFISRYPANIGRYTMLSHKKDEPNPRRYHYLYDGKKRFKSDGLNSVKYRTLDLQLRRLYTWVYVDLYPS
nr:beta-1,4-N-acetylgalactosaminyltransferase bre-4-like [Penaeus vannamei]